MSSNAAILTFPGVAAITSHASRYEQGQRHYWRKAENDFHNEQRRKTCRCCLGTGEMLVYIDEPAEPCARCQRSYLGDFDQNEPAF